MTDAFGKEIPEDPIASAAWETAEPDDLPDDVARMVELLRDTDPRRAA
jgi:hypothetical protein